MEILPPYVCTVVLLFTRAQRKDVALRLNFYGKYTLSCNRAVPFLLWAYHMYLNMRYSTEDLVVNNMLCVMYTLVCASHRNTLNTWCTYRPVWQQHVHAQTVLHAIFIDDNRYVYRMVLSTFIMFWFVSDNASKLCFLRKGTSRGYAV